MRVFTMLFAVMLCVMAVPVTAYAGGDDPEQTPIIEPITEPCTEATEPVTEPTQPEPTEPPLDPVPLTPPGNLTLVDDVSGEQAEDKQFITVVTKSGNFFYLVIDRAGDEENVHFLNLVDEADLMAIIESGEKPAPAPAPVMPEPEPEPEPQPEPEPTGNPAGIIVVVLLVAALGGGAFYYFKIRKPKQGAAMNPATTELDEFIFDEDEEDLGGEYIAEPEFEEAPDFAEGGEPVPDFTFAPDDTGAEQTESEDGQ
jgi:hypothetical protein